jgi:hypothetical protein
MVGSGVSGAARLVLLGDGAWATGTLQRLAADGYRVVAVLGRRSPTERGLGNAARALEGWDHAISADPAELSALVTGARDAYAALGSAVRTVDPAQRAKRAVFRRRLVMTRDLPRGARVGLEDVDFKRPGTGIRPDELPYVIGRPLARDVAAEEEIAWSDLA